MLTLPVAEIPNVRLNLSNRAENVLLVRQALSGLSEAIKLDAVELNDVSTAVSEACNNVVMHAYNGEEGPLEVEVYALGNELEVIVRDRGRGMRTPAQHGDDVGGIGLPVIRALSRSMEISEVTGGGTEVRMRFAITKTTAPEPAAGSDGHRAASSYPLAMPDATASLIVGPPRLARAVLPRVLTALAARAYFSTDRISDTQLLADALVAHSENSLDGDRLSVQVTATPRDLHLRLGPLQQGRAAAVLEDAAQDGLGTLLERLSNRHEISAHGSAEVLDLHLAERG
ncbi:MAG TPA: ATP-binding protein [Solirubrobacteraceae bacterium]